MDPENLEITPDMTPEEIEAIQNPGGGSPSPSPNPAPASQPPADHSYTVDPGPTDLSPEPADPAMTGRLTAAEQRAQEAQTRASLLEQNNRFLEQRAAESAAAAEKAKAEAQQHLEEARRLQEQIEQSTVPKLTSERRQQLVDLHGESGAQPLIDLEERFLATEHRYQREIAALKKSNGSLPDLVTKEFEKHNSAGRAAVFNETLMNAEQGVPDLPTLVKDQRFTDYLRSDPYGILATFNAAVQSNDPKAIPTIRSIVDKFKGNPPRHIDPGSSGTGGGRGNAGGPGGVTTRESAVSEWNRLLDAGQIEEAQAYAKKHKLSD